MNKVQAKMNFYHDLTGSRAMGECFEVDNQTLQTLEQAGYVERSQQTHANSEHAQAMQEIESKQGEYGQAQAKANEAVSLSAHEQNVKANEHTQQLKQEAQTRAEQNGADYTNEADQKAMQQAQNQFQPTAMPNVEANPSAQQTTKATARKADK